MHSIRVPVEQSLVDASAGCRRTALVLLFLQLLDLLLVTEAKGKLSFNMTLIEFMLIVLNLAVKFVTRPG